MRVTIKLRKSKLFKRLISESLHFACIKYRKKTKLPPERVEILEADLKLQLQNGSYQPEPAEIYTHRKDGKVTKFAKYQLQDDIVISAMYHLLPRRCS